MSSLKRMVRASAAALLGTTLVGCRGANPAGATIVAIPDPVLLQILAPKRETSSAPPPCCWQFVSDFHLHVTANGLMVVERITLKVTRKADGAVYTLTKVGDDVSYGATRLEAGNRQQWQIPVHILAVFDVPNESREFTLRIEARLMTKTGDFDLVLEPKMIEG